MQGCSRCRGRIVRRFRVSLPCVVPAISPRAAHPQYLGSSLCISAVGMLLHDADKAGNTLLAVWWVTLYLLTGILEEGACHSSPPFSPLAKGADPFRDTDSRPVVRHLPPLRFQSAP